MRRFLLLVIVSAFLAAFCVTSCRHKSNTILTPATDSSNFPDSIATILNKCTTSGCHNQASYQNAASLELDSWAHLFNGAINGAMVIPYSTTYSFLLAEVNPDSTLGPIVTDAPHNSYLTAAQYETLSNWIKNGAPDKNGNIPFASNADTRQKIYLTNQGCNLVAVIDAQSRQVMRYIPVGDANDQTPHDIKVSSDGAYAYVSLYNGDMVQKIDTRTDAVVGTLNLTSATLGGSIGGWSIIDLSPQDTAFMVSGYLCNYMVTANTATMQINTKKSLDVLNSGISSVFSSPHGVASNPTFDTFFTALQYGNEVIKFTFNPRFTPKTISVNGQPPVTTTSTDSTNPNPHYIIMSPDYSRYFVTCQQTGMVSVIDAHTDTLISQIQVGFYPQEMAICTSKNYLFVVCLDDHNNPTPNSYGSVYVIDYNNLSVVAKLYGNFNAPHDIAVDNQDGLLFIANRNVGSGSIPPHHSLSCGGTAGWYSVYDLNTLQPADNKQYDVQNDAYGIAPRFK